MAEAAQSGKAVSTLHYGHRRPREELDLTPFLVEQVEGLGDLGQPQTDEFLEEAPPAPYVPMKVGLDAGSQVDPSLVFGEAATWCLSSRCLQQQDDRAVF